MMLDRIPNFEVVDIEVPRIMVLVMHMLIIPQGAPDFFFNEMPVEQLRATIDFASWIAVGHHATCLS